MKVAYLANGQQVHIKEELSNGKYLIEELYEYQDQDGEWVYINSGSETVVTEVYLNKPIEKIDSEIKELNQIRENVQKELKVVQEEKRRAELELSEIKKSIVDEHRFIINKSELKNAKTLALFFVGEVMPAVLNNKDTSFWGLKISFYFQLSENGERAWGYRIYDESRGGYSIDRPLCEKYGFLVNPTEEEIEAIIIKRLSEMKFSTSALDNTPEKYLTKEQIADKKHRKEIENRNYISNYEKQVIDLQNKIKKLKEKI